MYNWDEKEQSMGNCAFYLRITQNKKKNSAIKGRVLWYGPVDATQSGIS